MLNSPSPLPMVPAWFLEELGRVIATWSYVEMTFHTIYLHLTDDRREFKIDDPALRSLGEAFKRRVRGLRERVAASRYSADQQQRINVLLDRLTQVHDTRDDLAHATFSGKLTGTEPNLQVAEDRVRAIFKSYRDQKDHVWADVTRASLQDTDRKMTSLYWDLNDAWAELPKGLARAP